MSSFRSTTTQSVTTADRLVRRVTGCPRGCQGSGTTFSDGGSAKVVVTAATTNSGLRFSDSSSVMTTAGRSFGYPFLSAIHAATIRPCRSLGRDRIDHFLLVGTNGISASSNHDCGGGFFFAHSISFLLSTGIGFFAGRSAARTVGFFRFARTLAGMLHLSAYFTATIHPFHFKITFPLCPPRIASKPF